MIGSAEGEPLVERSLRRSRPQARAPHRVAPGLATLSLLLALAALRPAAVMAADPPHWVASWGKAMTSSATQVKDADGSVRKDAYGDPVEQAPLVHDVTLRQVALVSLGGKQLRIVLSNYFGQQPLTVDSAHVARARQGAADSSAIDPGSDRALTFDGHASVTIAPGDSVTSDPVKLDVPTLSRVLVSLYFAGDARLGDMHPTGSVRTNYLVRGNHVGAAALGDLPEDKALGGHGNQIWELTGVQVAAPTDTRTLVAFGDSITDGAYATGLDRPWPEALAVLADAREHAHAAVINMGISGDELSTDQIGNPRAGTSGLKRFERDVIDRAGVTDVLVLFSTNDINRGIDPAGYPHGASAGDLIASLRMLADVAHQHHLRIYAGTITPMAGFPDPGWYSPAKEAVRQQVNAWIRRTPVFDGVIDFAGAVRGPYHPAPLAAQQHPLPPGMATVCAGDAGLHPNDRGYQAMAVAAYDTVFNGRLKPASPCH